MNEQENINVVRRTYELFKEGDVETLLTSYSDDISWETPQVENVPIGGKISGREAVADFFSRLADHQENLVFDLTDFIAQGDKVVVLGNFTWRVKSTNKKYTSNFAHIVTINDGKITGFYEYLDTAAAKEAYIAAQAA